MERKELTKKELDKKLLKALLSINGLNDLLIEHREDIIKHYSYAEYMYLDDLLNGNIEYYR